MWWFYIDAILNQFGNLYRNYKSFTEDVCLVKNYRIISVQVE